jgi:hypothetical protein
MTLDKKQADILGKIFGLTAEEKKWLMVVPYKGSLPTSVPTDPLIYRFYELISVYGTTFKELIHEEFGDGIMSAIDFKMDLQLAVSTPRLDYAGGQANLTLNPPAVFELEDRLPPATFAALRALVKRMEAAWRADEAASYYAANLDFHAALLEFGGGPRARRLYAELGNELHLYRRRALVQPENMRESNAEHAAILRAIAARDPATARTAGEVHIAGGKRRFQSTGTTPAPSTSTKTPRTTAAKGENHDRDHKDRPSRPAGRRLGARRGAARAR